MQLEKKPFKYLENVNNSELLYSKSTSQAGQDLFIVAMLQGKVDGSFLEIGAGSPIRSSNTFLLESQFNFGGVSIDSVDQGLCQPTVFELIWKNFYDNIKTTEWPEHADCLESCSDAIQKECRIVHDYDRYVEPYRSYVDGIPIEKRSWETIRPNTQFVKTDAFEFDYESLPTYYDYLQIDIEPPIDNLKILKKVLHGHRFGVITFEHDVWDGTPESSYVREESRKLLQDLGYELVVNDVTLDPETLAVLQDTTPYPKHFEDWYVDPKVVPRSVIDQYKWIDYSGRPKYYYDILFKHEV